MAQDTSHLEVKKLSRKQDAFARLLQTMEELRALCPWDQKQTWQSLRPLTIEETYELADALLDNEKPHEVKEELGDLLLHIVFYTKIAEENQWFDMADVMHNLCDKLVERHPHIYGEIEAADEETVKQNWEKIKLSSGNKSVLGGVPDSLPAVIKAYRMQQKTAQFGFEWNTKEEVWAKVEEELEELQQASPEEREEEFGDVLFSLINYARFIDVDPEMALAKTNVKFKSRFEYIEENAPKPLQEMSLQEMDQLWVEAKDSIRPAAPHFQKGEKE